jgi:hypothetical protein
MVNVSILTMSHARGLGTDGMLLREFGLAALMHDLSKVRTTKEILNKPESSPTTDSASCACTSWMAPRFCAELRMRLVRNWCGPTI